MALSFSVATGYPSVYPLRRSSRAAVFSAGCHPTAGCSEQLFVPEVVKAVDALYSDFRQVDNLVAHNATRVLKAFQNARVGSHVMGMMKLSIDGGLNWDALANAVTPQTKCSFIQRSCGYAWRKSLSILEIQRAIEIIKMQNPDCMVIVDNCYGEFVEAYEPPMVGADLIAGSLIKNPGGTIAPCGGYVAGRKSLVEMAAARLSAPGLGVDCGSTPGDVMRLLFQGLFLSPQMVGEAIKGGLLIAEVMASKGLKVQPLPRHPRHDTVQAVQLGCRERLIAFCEAVQRSCHIGSFIKPTAGCTPGYASEVIFADGTFIDGSTSELSCDGPLREPFTVFCQGGTHWTQWAFVLGKVLETI